MDVDLRRFRRGALPERLSPEQRLRLVGLTAREIEVALLIGRGLLVRAVAERMQVEPCTVKTLLARAREKLCCRNVRELTLLLIRERVVDPGELVDPTKLAGEVATGRVNPRLTEDQPRVDEMSALG